MFFIVSLEKFAHLCTQSLLLSDLERTKGNESFRNNEYEEAMRCYTKSLAFDHENAMAFANRAMAYIRLEIFDLAEEDR